MPYNFTKIEKKWQNIWEKESQAKDFSEKPKLYFLVEFPYPSGQGLHVGHCRSYTAMDILARKKRMQGYNVLFPIGWDAFGLPTENYALKTGIHPEVATKENTSNFKRQLKSLGFSFDWEREVNTTDPKYYKWTQWIFLQLFKNGLAYKSKIPINWCPSCKIGLANEEVINGKCERCGNKVIRKEKEQWLLKITKYADRLLKDLDKVNYPEKVKRLQRDWIGRSEGAEIEFRIKDEPNTIKVFTTRADTIFGVTYIALSPEHNLVSELKGKIKNIKEVEKYIESLREDPEEKDKKGIELKGIKAINPANKEEIPVFLANYILSNYGEGAIMGVPAHDQRDWEFAKKYSLDIKPVVEGGDIKEKAFEDIDNGKMINSGEFNGLFPRQAIGKIIKWMEKQGFGKKAVHYKIHDWVFSRQRYWGEPIPLIFCEKCGWVEVPEDELPVKLPEIKDYKPTEEGDSPLAKIDEWVNVKCPKCGEPAKRETDVMPNWAGSNWYFIRYCDPRNDERIADPKLLEYWLPVDRYNGGMEHTTLHLLYSRFIFKFLWDIGAVPKPVGPEPYVKRTSHGMVLGEGGIKMSKSRGNVVNPDEIVKEYGADTMRIYEMFMGPFDQAIAWDTKGLNGSQRFIEKVWKLKEKVKQIEDKEIEKLIQKTIKKVSEDIEAMKFNTAISALMIAVNEMQKQKTIPFKQFSSFLILFSVFAPHIAEEIWQNIGGKESIFLQEWPTYNEAIIKEDKVNIIIQVNGKFRGVIETEQNISEEEATNLSKHVVGKWLQGKKVKKVVFVKNKLINFVIYD